MPRLSLPAFNGGPPPRLAHQDRFPPVLLTGGSPAAGLTQITRSIYLRNELTHRLANQSPGTGASAHSFYLAHYFSQNMRFAVQVTQDPVANSSWAWRMGKIPGMADGEWGIPARGSAHAKARSYRWTQGLPTGSLQTCIAQHVASRRVSGR